MYLIRQKDYDAQIQAEILAILEGQKEGTLEIIENAVEQEMIGYMAGRFDVEQIFIDVPLWDTLEQYAIDQSVYHVDSNQVVRVFVATVANIGEEPWDEILEEVNPNWSLEDRRHPVIKMYFVDMVLYHLHSNVSKRQMPELRLERWDRALSWLKDLRDGKLQDPSLPVNTAGAAFHIRSGSGGAVNNSY